MARHAAERVTERLVDEVGNGLRTVVVVRPTGHDVVYLDDGLKRVYTEETFGEVVDTFRLEEPFLSPGIDGRPVGERRAILHYHTNAFVLQFPFSDDETILISVDPDVGRDLLGFIETCRALVHGE